MAGLRGQLGMRTSTMCLILESDMVGNEGIDSKIRVSVVRSSGRLEKHHGWRCRRQNFATGVGNAPRPQMPPPSASIGMLYQQRVGAPRGLQVSAPLTSCVNVVPAPWNHSDKR